MLEVEDVDLEVEAAADLKLGLVQAPKSSRRVLLVLKQNAGRD